MRTSYDVAMIQKPLGEGLSKEEMIDLMDLIADSDMIPYEVEGENATAMGFISIEAAEKINYKHNYQAGDGSLPRFIQAILNDTSKESEDWDYTYKCRVCPEISVYLGYAADEDYEG